MSSEHQDFQSELWDVIIVGSGASGGRFVKKLCDKGAKVLLIEAGAHFTSKDFPKNEFQASLELYWSGGAELDQTGKIGFLRGKGVGGTTLVNQALVDRFDDLVWDEWKQRSGIDFKEYDLAKAYDNVLSSFSVQSIPENQFGKNTKKFIEAFNAKKIKWAPLKRGQDNCENYDCIKCLGGCPRNSKQSSLVTAIEPALKKGLKISANTNITYVENSPDAVTIYGLKNSKKVKFKAKKLVLAAGSFGSTELLLKSNLPQMSQALGKNISCHPQYMVYSLFDEFIDAHLGAFQGVKSADPELREKGIKFENVFASPIGTAMLLKSFGKYHQELMLNYRSLASMEVAVRDEPTGQIFLDRKGNKHIQKDLTERDQKRRDLGIEMIKDMYSSVKAKDIYVGQEAFGLHLMGGCQMGITESSSVVSPDFHLHCAPNIYCADSSVFPSSSGINPSLTVMAFSELASEKVAESLGL